jgi:hypothetical protein
VKESLLSVEDAHPIAPSIRTSLSVQEWTERLLELTQRRIRTFVNEPGEMIAAYERERGNIDDY